MTVKEFLDAGDLSAAIRQSSEDVKAAPLDHAKRTFLFELLCCAGDLDRAAKQLDVMGGENSDREIAVQRFPCRNSPLPSHPVAWRRGRDRRRNKAARTRTSVSHGPAAPLSRPRCSAGWLRKGLRHREIP